MQQMNGSAEGPPVREPLAALLTKALESPNLVRSKDGGAALALVLHCLLVADGFAQLDARGRPQPGVYQPPKDWATRFTDEWVFTYARPGGALRFRLHCSLQAQTRRMFIHASEVDDNDVPIKDNIQVMGLQLENYVPDPARLQQRSWEGVIANEHTLVDMAQEFVITPLWRHAEKRPDGLTRADGSSGAAGLAERLAGAARALAEPRIALPVAVAVTGVAAAALVLWRRGQHPQPV